MEGSYRESVPSTALAVRPARRHTPVIRMSMLVGGGLLAAVLAPFAPVVALSAGIVASLGGYGLLGYSWTRAHHAMDALRALPFPLAHDHPDALGYGSYYRIVAVAVRLKVALDAPAREVVTQALPATMHAHAGHDLLTLTAGPRAAHELARLLTTWGVAVHDRYGIVDVHVSWTNPGPAGRL